MAQLIGNATIGHIINRINKFHVEAAPVGIVQRVFRDESDATGWNVTHKRADCEPLRALRRLRR